MENTRRSFLSQSLGSAVGAALYGSAALTTTLGLTGTSAALANTVEAATSSNELTSGAGWKAIGNANDSKRLRMVNVHTREKISVVYRNSEGYVEDALKQINFLLRDYRANEILQIDASTIDYLHQVYARMDTDEYIQILSGYRSPATNEMLRKRSKRVAKNSLHIVGKAIDFRIPGRDTKKLQLAALDLKLGGIGFYKKSDFVHIDSGHFRHW